MARPRRPLARIPGFRPAPYIEFMERMYSDVGITEDDMHVTEYAGETFVTPPLIDKEDHGEAT